MCGLTKAIGLGLKKDGTPLTTDMKLRVAAAIQLGRPSGTKWSFCTRDQKSHSVSIRSLGLLPAISAALIAPIEVPITQSGATPGLVQRLIDADLIGAERATALQDEDGLAERGNFLGSDLVMELPFMRPCGLLLGVWSQSRSPVIRRALRWKVR